MTLYTLFSWFNFRVRFLLELSDGTHPLREQVYDGTCMPKEQIEKYFDYIVESIIPVEGEAELWDAYLHIVIYKPHVID